MKSFRLLLAALLLPLLLSVGMAQAPAKVFNRGLNKQTAAQKQLRAEKKHWSYKDAPDYPASWSIISPANSMFLNDQDGDCVLAGECVNINAHWYKVTGQPVIISDAEVQAWGQSHDALNGYDLLPMIAAMSVTNSDGLTYSGSVSTMYCDGVGTPVSMNRPDICSACYACQGSLKMGVAGDDLQRIGAGNSNGWYLGSCHSTNIDHNVEMLGYGPASYCFQVLATPLPSGVDPTQFCYLVNTWSTIGVVNAAVVESSGWCNEIDMRTPTSIAISPSPTPTPTPTPTPGPTPTRRAADLLAALVAEYQDGSDSDKAEVLSVLSQGEKAAAKYKAKQHALAP
jgi:hypothetical protein